MAWCFEDEATPATEDVLDQVVESQRHCPGYLAL
jgi:hypothetical protein